ncbi:GntR family transcriptional regulator [Tabrizicola sp. J26]|uniref:GntR family transcriptional regulator n=1 Tax=Alitabrizicola rongguiensis TaxID=2909234 RepID=UPI001F444302|nr:GntR family transcriptional regulator [Tabrizicola rongguiensis]MCF1709926.1 GntR family transcriptional regulator [Tabrizicola rongguiensis]
MLPVNDPETQEPIQPESLLTPLTAFEGSLGQKVYLSLKQAIIALVFKPGEALRKQEICDRLGVSRSPVSEAVARLAGEGLVEVVPQAGTFVARFSMQEIREGAFLREALELAAVEMVAKTITDEQIALLKRNLRVQEVLVADGDQAGFYEMDSQMHELILSFTGFRRLAPIAETLWVQVNRARQLVLPRPGRLQATIKEHKAIIAALEAREPYGARAATRTHLRQLVSLLEETAKQKPELFAEPVQRP